VPTRSERLRAGFVVLAFLLLAGYAVALPFGLHRPVLLALTVPAFMLLGRLWHRERRKRALRGKDLLAGAALAYASLGVVGLAVTMALLAATGQLPWPPP
jgi:hypothetical protein